MHPERDKILIDIKSKLKEGKTQVDIITFLREKYEKPPSNQNIVWMINEGKSLIQRELDFNIRDIMIRNASRYEEIWRKNFNTPLRRNLENPDDDLEDEDIRKTLYKISNHYMIASDALKRKEKLLGLTHNRMDIHLNNEFREKEYEKVEDESNFDPSRLTLEENLELLELLKKAKGEFREKVTTTTTVTVTQANKEEKIRYEQVVDKFDIEEIEYQEVEQASGSLKINEINRGIIKEESEKFNEQILQQKAKENKEKVLANKKKLLEKFKKVKK
jgi:hypothetical protein